MTENAMTATAVKRTGSLAAISYAAAPLALIALPALASLPTMQPLALVGLALSLAGLWWTRGTPLATLALLSVVAWCSRLTIPVAGMNMRIEQPLIVVSAVWLTWAARGEALRILRQLWPALLGLAVWLAAGTLSSLLIAPDRAASLRIVVWLGLSVAAAWVAILLVRRMPRGVAVGQAFVMAGIAQAAIAVWALISGRLLGIGWGGWSFVDGNGAFRAFALSWEPNIFAAAVALTVPFAIDAWRRSATSRDLAILVLLCFGVGLGLTRASWIALGAGLGAYALFAVLAARPSLALIRVVATSAVVITVATWAGTLVGLESRVATVPALGQTAVVMPAPADLPPRPTIPGQASPTPLPPTPEPTEGPGPGPAPTPPPAVDIGSDQNIAFRLERVRLALTDLRTSPWIGLGVNSFGQRHEDATQAFLPDYLGVFPVTVIYDSGLIGFCALLAFGLWLSVAVWRSRIPERAAFLASFAVMIPAYAATDAFRFAQNWLIIGAGLGLAVIVRGRGVDHGN